MNEKTIHNLLDDDYNFLIQEVNENQLLGLTTYGRVVEGWSTQENDLKVIATYLPTFKELCAEKAIFKIITRGNHIVELIDARIILKQLVHQENKVLEGLNSKYHKINPKYEKTFMKNIYDNRERISRYNVKEKVLNDYNNVITLLQKYKENNDTECLFDACRIKIECDLYLDGIPYEECVRINKSYLKDYLLNIKEGRITPNEEDIINDFNNLLKEKSFSEKDSNIESIVKMAIVEIMREASKEPINKEAFLEKLTIMEKEALQIIFKHINKDKGTISISQLTRECDISRSVFKNVLQKMKDAEVANITNMGAKGTYIELLISI